MALIFGTERVVDSSCGEYSCTNGTSDELVALTSDGIQDGGVGTGHETSKGGGAGEPEAFFNLQRPGEYILSEFSGTEEGRQLCRDL